MAISFVNATSGHDNNATTTSISMTVPSGVVDGDFLVAIFNTGNGSSGLTLTGWTAFTGTPFNDAIDTAGGVWYRAASSEPASYTLSWTAAGHYAYSMLHFTGVDTTTPVRTSAQSNKGSIGTTYTPGTLTGVQATDVTVYCGIGGDDNATLGDTFTMPATPWNTAINNQPGATTYKGNCATYQTGSTSAPTYTCSSASFMWCSFAFALQAAVAVPPVAEQLVVGQRAEIVNSFYW